MADVMPISTNPFIGLDMPTLLAGRALWLKVLGEVASGGQSYSFPNRTFTRADLGMIKATISEYRLAIEYTTNPNTGKQFVQAIINTQSRFAG